MCDAIVCRIVDCSAVCEVVVVLVIHFLNVGTDSCCDPISARHSADNKTAFCSELCSSLPTAHVQVISV